MNRTIIVRRNYAHYIKKYARCGIQTQFNSTVDLMVSQDCWQKIRE